MAAKILKFNGHKPLVMADNEHYTVSCWTGSQKHHLMICWFRCLTIHRFEDQFSR